MHEFETHNISKQKVFLDRPMCQLRPSESPSHSTRGSSSPEDADPGQTEAGIVCWHLAICHRTRTHQHEIRGNDNNNVPLRLTKLKGETIIPTPHPGWRGIGDDGNPGLLRTWWNCSTLSPRRNGTKYPRPLHAYWARGRARDRGR